MTKRPVPPSKKALFGAAALSFLVSLVAPGCTRSGGESRVSPCELSLKCGARCSASEPCTVGQYCNADQVCTADCTPTDGNCGSDHTCSSSGRCVAGGGIDPGVDPGTGDGGPDDLPDGCVKQDVKLTPQLTVLMLIDQSGSMNEQFGTGARWNVLRDALIDMNTGIISTLQSKVRFGLALYTSEGGFGDGTPPKTCPMITQVAPALDNYAAITAKYLSDDWKGDTPTGESIDAAVKILDGVTDPGPKVLVLATDGEPDSCADPNPGDAAGHDAARQLSVTAVQNAFQKQISTFVISVGNEVGKDHLRAVANAGQGLAVDVDMTDRFYLANDQADLSKAFDSIVGGVRSCVFTLNGTVEDSRADSGTVVLDGKPLVYKDKDGWFLSSPSVLELQGAACATIKSTGNHDLNIDFPCGVIIPTIPK
ncbi:MAG TPA: vWA domain-containing protein [Polyangiaceae bacterium]|nr:vWA domain-containing protein [Polyangiaceae bacterium]